MNFFKIAVIVLFILATVITAAIRPGVHNPMIIENEDFKLARISDEVKQIPVVYTPEQTKTVQEVQIAEPQTQTVTQQIVYDTPKSKPQERVVQTQNVQPSPKSINITTDTNPSNKSQLELLQKIMQNAEQAERLAEQKPQPKPVEKPQPQPKPKPIEKQVQVTQTPQNVETKPVKTGSNPYMTEEEEIIAWNVWRSNLHNQIMKDSDVGSAFVGTIFSFSFIVDKFGNVSNIKVEAFPPYFMDIARDGVKPAIQRLQNKPILNFPRGTKRTTTVVEGKFAVGTVNRFSTPGEYSDYERVTR